MTIMRILDTRYHYERRKIIYVWDKSMSIDLLLNNFIERSK